MTASATSRRRFYFSLRTLFVAVTILGLFLGWVGVQLKWMRDRRQALEWMFPCHARQLAAESGSLLPPLKGEYISHPDTKAPWSLRIFGESGVERIKVYENWLNPDARYSVNDLRLLFPEAEVKAVANRKLTVPKDSEWIVEEDAVDQSVPAK